MKVAVIGQSLFAASVLKLLQEEGHEIVGVFTIPDKSNREDTVATVAAELNIPVFKISRWRVKGKLIPEVFAQYRSVNAELNVLPYCTQFIPLEVINYPKHKSIGYHPSLLPKHRGASSINWTIICGDEKAGFSIFWPDDGLDTGPLLLQKECLIEENDTVDTLYNRFLFPEGIKAFKESLKLIENGSSPKTQQSEIGATYDPMLNKAELTMIQFEKLSGQQLHNFIRGMDKVPGAWLTLDQKVVKVFGSKIYSNVEVPNGTEVEIENMTRKGIVFNDGLLLFGNDGIPVVVNKLMCDDGKMIAAAKYGQDEVQTDLEFTAEEQQIVDDIKAIWESILRCEVNLEMDFFKSGAGSMDVTRLVEEIKERCVVDIENEDVYMASMFTEFVKTVVLKSRGDSKTPKLVFDAVHVTVNKRDISFANQLFINNQFMNTTGKLKPLQCINPTDESLICEVQNASSEDVNMAVNAAKVAFEEGEWSKMNARDRGKILYKLADLMEQHKEELAIIESLDSGAVYTLALKTHIGMSIDTWRYFAGWCDKIEGSTIPINHARPNRNLTITKKEPIGVCGIITPWNYPLMMVSWKTAACLAAGNTVVLKPAQVCPLTALKLAELSVHAGFPPGVINVLPGTGSVCGQAIADHPQVRKLGFTGSTPIGKDIMRSCAVSNLKKVSLELGGKSPLIIFADAEMDKSVRQAMGGVFFNKGENCIAAGRIFVEDSIHDTFVEKVVAETKKMVIGDPLDRSTAHGPQNHRKHMEKLIEYCEIGVKEKAKLVYGGYQVPRPGLFFTPTIFTEVEDNMYMAREESFGPIMIISRFKDGDIEGVLKRANNTEYGLASGVFTKDISKALLVSEKIQAGTCFVNCYNKTDVAAPFGGFKQSGFGKDLGQEALNEYLKTKTITIEY